MDELKNRNIKKEINAKLNDSVLRNALDRFAEAYPIGHARAYENVEDFDALRNSVRDMKQAVVANIEAVADKFEAEAAKRGAKVFRATDGDELKEYLLRLCRQRNVHRIVKSKSMASEEIHLNPDLEAAGLRVKETDLGEWIITLVGQRPLHMVMPAINLSKEQVADYLSKELKEQIPPDIPLMVKVARKTLRDEFLQADMGITGANFGIAENGAIGFVTNEGNARITSTLPRIHVVIIGYEKLVSTIKDVTPILRTLPRSATAQLMTAYVSMISGPVPTLINEDGQWVEADKELHIILLDNGRLKVAKDEKFKQIFQCVRCGSCLNVCPVYQLVGGHVYGHIYVGGIGAILTAVLSSLKDFSVINELCIGCRKCTTVCPGKIDIPGLIEELRVRNINENGLPFSVSTVLENVIAKRKIFHSLLRVASLAQKPFKSGHYVRHLPLFLAGITKDRSLPAIADIPLRDRIPKITRNNNNPSKRVAFFSGCNIDFVCPDTGESVYQVLQELNIQVVFPQDQSCCGKPVISVGNEEATRKIAKRNIEALEATDVDYIIAACPNCTATLNATYAEILHNDPEWSARVEKFARKVREFSQFVAEEYEKAGRLDKQKMNGKKVTMHDSCHMKRVLEIFDEPRKLLSTKGYELVEMKDGDKCCGMAGAFGMKYPELSLPILNQKIQNIKNSGAGIVAVACPACMTQIGGGLDKQAPDINVKHIADLLAGK